MAKISFDWETFLAVGAALLAFYVAYDLLLKNVMAKLAEKIKNALKL